VHARVGEEEALPLEPHAKVRSDARLPHHREVMHGVEEAERKARDGQLIADLEPVEFERQVLQPEGVHHAARRHRVAVQFQCGDVDLAAAVARLMPDGDSIAMQQDGQRGQPRQTVSVGVHLDFDAVGRMATRGIEQHMPTGDKKELAVALEERAAG
jgi:hypothetical protein